MNIFPTKSGTLYFDGAPDREFLDELKSKGVEVIWNLGYELLEEAEMEREIFKTVIHTPIVDYSVPTSKAAFEADIQVVHYFLEAGKTCFVHCFGGHGRTGMALACLAILDGNECEQALKLARHYCSGPEREIQVDFVRKFYGVSK